LEGGITGGGTTDDASVTGQLEIENPADNMTFTLTEPTKPLTSGSVEIEWILSNNGTTLTGTAGGEDVIIITVDGQGEYSVDLKAPIDHPDTPVEDTLSFEVDVRVSDGI